jgi:hypothetical protein
MTAYIVCEEEHDAHVLKRLLSEELVGNVEIVAAGGLSAVKSLARSLVVRRQSPVAIVADADATIPEQVEQRLKDTEEIVENIAVNTPVKVILAVPTLEIIFFQDVSLLSRLLGYTPSQDLLSLAVHQPWQALNQLISQSKNLQSQSQLVDQLTTEDLEALRQAPVIQEIVQFLQSVRETADAL